MCAAEPFIIDAPRAGAVPSAFQSRKTRGETTVEFHEHGVPSYVESALDTLYGSVFSTLDQFRIDNSLESASTYIARCGSVIRAVLLYRIENGVATVLNQLIGIERDELARFADALFKHHADVSAIVLMPVRTDMKGFSFPCQQYHFAEDIVAALPETNIQYLAALGKNMRETVKRYSNKVRRTFPSYRFDIYVDGQIDMDQAMEIYRMHIARMDTKMRRSHLDERRYRKLVALARARGLMAIATIDGKVCGGLLCCRADTHYFMRVIAHDPRYDEFKMGTVCCYETIRESIARGATHFHFGSGRLLYKYRLLGVGQSFSSIVIYRSYAAVLRHARLAARTALRGADRELRHWLEDAEECDDRLARAAIGLRQHWREIRSTAKSLLHRGSRKTI